MFPEPQRFIAATRVALVTIPSAALQRRLRSRTEAFVAATLVAPGAYADVAYPATWPGEAVALFPALLSRRSFASDGEEWLFAVVERARRTCVGNMGTHGPPVDGAVEIGYAIEPAERNAGYATEMLGAYAAALLARADVRVVVAETLVANVASQRVLEKTGFSRNGSRVDAEGEFLRWELRRATEPES